jgi:hypothetical protein
VLYFPLEVDTLFPVTTENIGTRGGEILIEARAEIDRLKEAIATDMDVVISSDSYTNQIVRVVIFDGSKGKGPYAIIEADGVCRLSTNRVIRLRPATLETIRALIERHLKRPP